MGSIMCIGVATANSILLVTFANDERASMPRRARGDAVGRLRAHPAGADDRGRDDPGHAADGARPGRGRRAERAARPRRDRRADRRDHRRRYSSFRSFIRTCGGRRRDHEQRLQAEELRKRASMVDPSSREERYGIRRPTRKTVSALVFACAVALVVAFLAGYLPMQQRESALRAEADAQQKQAPRVPVMRVSRGLAQTTFTLPGTMQAITEAPILARADGYLKRRAADLGDRVRAGQALAEIEAPELDQQIEQAEATVEQAQAAIGQAEASLAQGKANRDLARLTADRLQKLNERGIATQQDRDQSQAQLAAQDANVQAAEKLVAAQRSSLSAAQRQSRPSAVPSTPIERSRRRSTA